MMIYAAAAIAFVLIGFWLLRSKTNSPDSSNGNEKYIQKGSAIIWESALAVKVVIVLLQIQ